MGHLYLVRKNDLQLEFDTEINQEAEAISEELAQIKRWARLSPRQRENYVKAQILSPKDSVLRIIENLSDVYDRLPS